MLRRCCTYSRNNPVITQQVELPLIKPIIKQIERHRFCCYACGFSGISEDKLFASSFGPRLVSFITYLKAIFIFLSGYSQSLKRFVRKLLGAYEKLWLFIFEENVEPTNNLAERDLRPLVLWRKKSFGTKSQRGNKFVQTMSSIVMTFLRFNKNVFNYLEESISSILSGAACPSIKPLLV